MDDWEKWVYDDDEQPPDTEPEELPETDSGPGRGVIRNLPHTRANKTARRFPSDLSEHPPKLFWWCEDKNDFVEYSDYDALQTAGAFDYDRDKNIIFLVGGWQQQQNDSHSFFKAALRYHARMTPKASLLYVDWDNIGANSTKLYDAYAAAWRVNLTEFLTNVSINGSSVHCIGYSVGTYVCTTICRQYFNVSGYRCDRIVAIDHRDEIAVNATLEKRALTRTLRNDAKYVAALRSTWSNMNVTDEEVHEYITIPNITANSKICDNKSSWGIDVCGLNFYGQRFCEYFGHENFTFEDDHTCTKFIGLIEFLRTLDVNGALPLIQMYPGFPHPVGSAVPSVWSAYTLGRDYRYKSYVSNHSVWYMGNFGVNGTSIFPVYTFQVVASTATDATILGGAYEVKKKHGLFSVTAAFVQGSRSYLPENVTILTNNTRGAHLMSTYATAAKAYVGMLHDVPMTSEWIAPYYCSTKSNGFDCTQPWYATGFHTSIPVYRRQLRVMDKHVPIPPKKGCLPYKPPNEIQISWRREEINIAVGQNVTISPAYEAHSQAVVLENAETKTTVPLITFYDVCDMSAKSDVYFDLDWKRMNLTLHFPNAGFFVVRWYFVYERLDVVVSVRPTTARVS
ncbi:lipase [Falconid herpesvirus 1]|uniref:Lipase n=2 Tax=Columbid alphaherpesvirus 1 TaxID=93386 RepID=A0A068EPG2_9ALPH|nr:lipase [Falconid herpesvirus 1]YP_009352902.1 lipase [Columbid alphaherpesvirus 1]AID52698.1 lipase [Falconid herpesvirus 1]ARD71319.1 lipase [Columbid alphaherpesvirus 1]